MQQFRPIDSALDVGPYPRTPALQRLRGHRRRRGDGYAARPFIWPRPASMWCCSSAARWAADQPPAPPVACARSSPTRSTSSSRRRSLEAFARLRAPARLGDRPAPGRLPVRAQPRVRCRRLRPTASRCRTRTASRHRCSPPIRRASCARCWPARTSSPRRTALTTATRPPRRWSRATPTVPARSGLGCRPAAPSPRSRARVHGSWRCRPKVAGSGRRR